MDLAGRTTATPAPASLALTNAHLLVMVGPADQVLSGWASAIAGRGWLGLHNFPRSAHFDQDHFRYLSVR